MAHNNPKQIFEIFNDVVSAKKEADKIAILRAHNVWPVKDILRGAFDDTIKWNLPEGKPPYTPCRPESCPTNLLRANSNYKYLVKGVKESDTLPKFKREKMFIAMLEGVHPEEALILIEMVNKRPPVKGLTKELVQKAFPGLIKS